MHHRFPRFPRGGDDACTQRHGQGCGSNQLRVRFDLHGERGGPTLELMRFRPPDMCSSVEIVAVPEAFSPQSFAVVLG